MFRIAIFASGNGSNAENIIRFFENREEISVDLVLTNNPKAFVIERAKNLSIPVIVFNRKQFYTTDEIIKTLLNHQIDLIVLAGFMWLIPNNMVSSFPQQIINIHPALLPKFGGKGMYGDFVHQAVSEAKETNTGITIHYVNENYDEGAVIFQKEVQILSGETPESIAQKVHNLEYEYFPKIIAQLLEKLNN